jgi:hypothetical protein
MSSESCGEKLNSALECISGDKYDIQEKLTLASIRIHITYPEKKSFSESCHKKVSLSALVTCKRAKHQSQLKR